ncbi:hypothetical protein RJ639_046702 [Escallonia herrerae]|uniref:UBA domain-containing protein n=1 Tax=Escallonia herrerae TaxID=1293975 RepID=A0AA88WB30_9ASTE|nr:hypothetical protein RJ639_046702 [Escallonia herrerae]
MSPATKSKTKSKEKPSARTSKEQQKASSKLTGSANTGNGNPASAYNPASGTFHSLDTAPMASSPPLSSNGRFRNMDDTDEHSGSSHGTAVEYDSLSNNGSCSGESEDHKEKGASTVPRQENIPGTDNEKREKIRQKNEKKHQRQRERRAQELHERCSGYLMSRKLEALSQQLVAMGFSSERATLALMLNGGRVEESVNWLFEVSEEEAQKKDGVSHLKIDINEEFARIAQLEARFKCLKQDVERAVVACEGDLDKAEETLKSQRPEPTVAPPKAEETSNAKHFLIPQERPTDSVSTQLNRAERDIHYGKGVAAVSTIEHGNRNMQFSRTNQLKPTAEKRWQAGSSSSLPHSMDSSVQIAPPSVKMMSQLGVEGRNIQQGPVREPVIMMQRPQSVSFKQIPVAKISASPPGTSGWYANNGLGVEGMNVNGTLVHNQNTGSLRAESPSSQHFFSQAQINRNMGQDNVSSNHYHLQAQYPPHTFISSTVDPAAAMLGGSWNTTGASSAPLTVPSSLGLFSGWGSAGTSGSASHVDWNTRDMMSRCDYNSIDWTLESNISSSNSNGLMPGLYSMSKAGTNDSHIGGFQDRGIPVEAAASSGGPREWTSPFAGKDIFSVPRQFVTSPSP